VEELLSHWSISDSAKISPITAGLINGTFKVVLDSTKSSYILQQINLDVFPIPADLMSNHQNIEQHLRESQFPLKGPEWITSYNGDRLVKHEGGFWRLGVYYNDTQSYSSARDDHMAWNIGRAFGQYDKGLSELKTSKLKDTISEFHNLQRYLDKLSLTIKAASHHRLQIAKSLIQTIDDYLFVAKLPFPKNRVIHNDAKVSNLLFRNDEVFAVIDWDTTMSGHISWEYADLFRTTVVNVPEDHPDLSVISLQYDMMDALHAGYKSELFDFITLKEKESLYHGALYLILEQAVRFLEDYLAEDIYYRCDYDDHNFIRSRNQFYLLSLMNQDQEAIIQSIKKS